MKNLNKAYYKAYNQITALGIQTGFIDDITINTRATRRWGMCSYNANKDSYTIQISNRLLDDNVSEEALMNTLIHEILHTVDGCMNHGENWQAVANKINTAYGYNIKRTTSNEEKGLKPIPSKESYHYIIHCNNCNATWKYKRYSRIVKSCEHNNAKCGCGGKIFTVEYI